MPIVSTGSFNTKAVAVAPSMATIGPGMRLESMRQTSMVATVATARIVAVGDHVGELAASAFIRNQNTPGTLSRCSPKKSFTCVLAIKTAIPLVNPITTGRGINFTPVPIPVAPITTSRIPAITVHMNKPSTPCAATMPICPRYQSVSSGPLAK